MLISPSVCYMKLIHTYRKTRIIARHYMTSLCLIEFYEKTPLSICNSSTNSSNQPEEHETGKKKSCIGQRVKTAVDGSCYPLSINKVLLKHSHTH